MSYDFRSHYAMSGCNAPSGSPSLECRTVGFPLVMAPKSKRMYLRESPGERTFPSC